MDMIKNFKQQINQENIKTDSLSISWNDDQEETEKAKMVQELIDLN